MVVPALFNTYKISVADKRLILFSPPSPAEVWNLIQLSGALPNCIEENSIGGTDYGRYCARVTDMAISFWAKGRPEIAPKMAGEEERYIFDRSQLTAPNFIDCVPNYCHLDSLLHFFYLSPSPSYNSPRGAPAEQIIHRRGLPWVFCHYGNDGGNIKGL